MTIKNLLKKRQQIHDWIPNVQLARVKLAQFFVTMAAIFFCFYHRTSVLGVFFLAGVLPVFFAETYIWFQFRQNMSGANEMLNGDKRDK